MIEKDGINMEKFDDYSSGNCWQNHYPVIIIFIVLTVACGVVGFITKWVVFCYAFYLLITIGIVYLLWILPWFLLSKKKDINEGVLTALKGSSAIIAMTCSILFLYFNWSDTIGKRPEDEIGLSMIKENVPDSNYPIKSANINDNDDLDRLVYVSKSKKYHELWCGNANENMQLMTCQEAILKGIKPCKNCHR